MTVQDARTPASNQPEAGKSIGWHKGYVETDVRRGLAPLRENWIIGRGDTEEYAGRPVRPEDDGIKHPTPRDGLSNLDAVFPGRPRQPRRSRDGRAVTQ